MKLVKELLSDRTNLSTSDFNFLEHLKNTGWEGFLKDLLSQFSIVDEIDTDIVFSVCLNIHFKNNNSKINLLNFEDYSYFWEKVQDFLDDEDAIIYRTDIYTPTVKSFKIYYDYDELHEYVVFDDFIDITSKIVNSLISAISRQVTFNHKCIFSNDFNKKIQNYLLDLFKNKYNERKILRDQLINKTGKLSYVELLYSLMFNDVIKFKNEYNIEQIAIFQKLFVKNNIFNTKYFITVETFQLFSTAKCYKRTDHIEVNSFTTKLNINELPIQILTKTEKEQELLKRKEILKIYCSSIYFEYVGNCYFKGFFGHFSRKADGRCVIDLKTFCKFLPDKADDIDLEAIESNDDKVINIDKLNDEYLLIINSILYGYSLTLKNWAMFSIFGLSKINFNPNVYNLLALEENKKEFLRKLCMNHNKFQDLIQNKNGGQIILLYGGTGTGKTLTAEILAEIKQTPLYVITVGELGIDLEDVEKTLTTILEISQLWNAIILLDEADIFLEQRNQNDLHRNAIVSIFLRKLEYFDGTMILTTNRKDNIDPAILSRLTCLIKYDELNAEKRKCIWKNLITYQQTCKFNLTDQDYDKLSEIQLNGREIKNIIKNTLWVNNCNSILTYDDLINVYKIARA